MLRRLRVQCIIVFGFVWYEPLQYDTYVYPWWANLLGWMMALSSILCMPVLALGAILLTSGSLREVCSSCSFGSIMFDYFNSFQVLRFFSHISVCFNLCNENGGGMR